MGHRIVGWPRPTPQKKLIKSRAELLSNLADRQTNTQTDGQTDRPENMTSFFGGGNKRQKGVSLSLYKVFRTFL